MKTKLTTTDIDQIKLFDVLSTFQREEILNNSSLYNFEKNERIYGDSEDIKFVYLVREGSVKVGMNASNGKTLIKNIIYKGELFGENIFTPMTQRSEFAEALKTATVLKIPSYIFKKIVASNHLFAQKITQIIIQRLQNLEERLQSFVFKKAKARIVDFIKKTATLKGVKIGIEEVLIHHGMSHKEIAYLTDTSRQTVARVLGELKNDKLIHFSPRKPSKILIRNMMAFG